VLAVKKCAIPYVPPRTEAAMRSTPLLRVVSTFWEHTMMTVSTRYRGRQAWMAATSADRDRHTAITADVPNQNLMPYCRYRFSLQMATAVVKQQPGALRRKPASLHCLLVWFAVLSAEWRSTAWRLFLHVLPFAEKASKGCCKEAAGTHSLHQTGMMAVSSTVPDTNFCNALL